MMSEPQANDPPLAADWPFPASAALGSFVRTQGILREIRARLPFPDRKRLTLEDGRVRLRIPAGEDRRFETACAIVAKVLDGADALPVLPSEAEDILTIASRERQKWTKDGRMNSAGTRTVKLRGRARTVTFHVFDPRHIEDVLDRDLPTLWREEDARTGAENRRRAAGKAALLRASRQGGAKESEKAVRPDAGRDGNEIARRDLDGWDAFEMDGLLR